jgi:hypothetical protein
MHCSEHGEVRQRALQGHCNNFISEIGVAQKKACLYRLAFRTRSCQRSWGPLVILSSLGFIAFVSA